MSTKCVVLEALSNVVLSLEGLMDLGSKCSFIVSIELRNIAAPYTAAHAITTRTIRPIATCP
jgi:hypothetical protein